MIATTISQSRKLIELGLDETTADMYYPYLGAGQYGDTPRVGFPIEYSGGRDIPAWSLSALLEVIPPFIKGHHLKIEKTRITDMWYLDYQYLTDSEPRKDLLTAAYEMVCWLLENDLIKKGVQD